MRILCSICKKNREIPAELIEGKKYPVMLYHTNPDSQKYYCFLSGDLTDAEHKRELKIEDLDTEEESLLKKKKHRYKAVYRKRYRETK